MGEKLLDTDLIQSNRHLSNPSGVLDTGVGSEVTAMASVLKEVTMYRQQSMSPKKTEEGEERRPKG